MVRVRVKVKPGSRTEGIEGFDEQGALRVKVRAVPDRGKANRAVELLIAKTLAAPRTSVQVVSGHASREKTVACHTVAGRDEFERLIAGSMHGTATRKDH